MRFAADNFSKIRELQFRDGGTGYKIDVDEETTLLMLESDRVSEQLLQLLGFLPHNQPDEATIEEERISMCMALGVPITIPDSELVRLAARVSYKHQPAAAGNLVPDLKLAGGTPATAATARFPDSAAIRFSSVPFVQSFSNDVANAQPPGGAPNPPEPVAPSAAVNKAQSVSQPKLPELRSSISTRISQPAPQPEPEGWLPRLLVAIRKILAKI